MRNLVKNGENVLSKKINKNHGGVKRDRTADLLNAIQALSQLSYNPNKDFVILHYFTYKIFKFRRYAKIFSARTAIKWNFKLALGNISFLCAGIAQW